MFESTKYNVSVFAEEKADRLTDEPVEEINEALGRVRVNLEKQKRQGVGPS